jgi:RNA polymerase-binding transcription factor DksA
VKSQPVAQPTAAPVTKQAPLVTTSKPVVAAPLPPPVAVKPEPKKPAAPPKPVKVVIPEMKTKTVRKYEPEFTKSVLDTPQEEQTGPTMRYSDAELGEFRELINRKLDAAKKELAYLQGLITRKDEMGGDNDDARYMTMEDGSMSMEREQLSQMASRQITFIDHLEKAIMRIENKTYGICRVTGKLIDKARLRAVPHATLSIEAKQMMNK